MDGKWGPREPLRQGRINSEARAPVKRGHVIHITFTALGEAGGAATLYTGAHAG